MDSKDRLSRLRESYRAVFRSPEGPVVLNDLVIFAQQAKDDPAVRAGRADVILRILREQARSGGGMQPIREDEE